MFSFLPAHCLQKQKTKTKWTSLKCILLVRLCALIYWVIDHLLRHLSVVFFMRKALWLKQRSPPLPWDGMIILWFSSAAWGTRPVSWGQVYWLIAIFRQTLCGLAHHLLTWERSINWARISHCFLLFWNEHNSHWSQLITVVVGCCTNERHTHTSMNHVLLQGVFSNNLTCWVYRFMDDVGYPCWKGREQQITPITVCLQTGNRLKHLQDRAPFIDLLLFPTLRHPDVKVMNWWLI